MRICIISKFIPPKHTDGIPRTRWEYAKQFIKKGHEVHIITSGHENNEFIVDGIFIHEIASWDQEVYDSFFQTGIYDQKTCALLMYSYLVTARIERLNNIFPVDIIDSPLWDIEGFITKLRMPHIPLVVRLETTSMLLEEIIKEKIPLKNQINDIETRFMQLADGLVFDSWSIYKETARLYGVNFSTKNCITIYHGISETDGLSFPNSPNNRQQGKPLKILSVGRLEKRKGTDVLFQKILPEALKKLDDVEFHFVGRDSAEWTVLRIKLV